MWEYYDDSPGGTSSEVDAQLAQLKSIGCNTVRVFLSFPSWNFYDNGTSPNQFIERFRLFLKLCGEHGLFCIPVLWDNTLQGSSNPPDYSNYYAASHMTEWHSNPGEPMIERFIEFPSFQGTQAEKYLEELSDAVEDRPAFLAWDLINEAAIEWSTLAPFLLYTLDVLERENPTQPTILSMFFAQSSSPLYPEAHQLASDPRIDIHSIHNYFQSQDALRSLVWDATHIEVDPNALVPPNPKFFPSKPVIATENGSPGQGFNYADGLHFAMNVRRDDLGPGEMGIGTLAWVSHVGSGNYPFNLLSGVFYADGTVRDLSVVHAFVSAAQAQGYAPNGYQSIQEIADFSPGWIPQFPVSRDYDNHSEQEAMLLLPDDELPSVIDTWQKYREWHYVMSWMTNSVQAPVVFTAPGNDNPYVSANPPAWSSLPLSYYVLLLTWSQKTSFPGAAPYPSSPITDAVEQATGVAFDPASNPEQLKLLVEIVFPAWRNIIRPYYISQGDNNDS